MIQIQHDPSPRELRIFGLALLAFFALLGGILRYHLGPNLGSKSLWIGGAVLVGIYYAVRPVRRPVFVAWSYLTYPLGWLLSFLVLAVTYYGILTPIGWLRRLGSEDPMARRFDEERRSYWEERERPADSDRYFRQF